MIQKIFQFLAGPFRSHSETLEDQDEPPSLTEKKVHPDDQDILEKFLELYETTADDIKIPRADIIALDIHSSYEKALDTFTRHGLGRMPVYEKALDNIVGYIHVNSLLQYAKSSAPFHVKSLLKDPLFISPSMPLIDLLNQMRFTHTPIAIVVDEHGGVDGLITGWGLIRHVIGDIDASDKGNAAQILPLQDGSSIVNARLEMNDFVNQFGNILTPEESDQDIETVGGLVIFLAGKVPAAGERISHTSGLTFEVMNADPRCVKKIRILPKTLEAKTTKSP